MSYTIAFEEDGGILVCRMSGFLEQAEALSFGAELRAAVSSGRVSAGVLKVLFDNREGHVVAPAAAAALVEQMKSTTMPGDRSAIIVPNSLSKIQARRTTTSEHELFVSEAEARAWLTGGPS